MQNWWIAARALKRQPRSTAAAIAVLACGMAAVTVTLSLGYVLIVQPLPWKDADRIIKIRHARDVDNKALAELAPANFIDIRDNTRIFEGLAAWVGISKTLKGGLYPEALHGVAASASLFSLLAITPQFGRYYNENETGTVVISQEVWRRQFGMSPDVIGKVIEIDGQSHQIIGVIPQSLSYPEGADFWVPLSSFAPLFAIRETPLFSVLAKLKPGGDLRGTQRELDFLAAQLHQRYPASANVRFSPQFFRASLFGDIRPILIILLTASTFLLAVACINIMTILFSAALARRQELAVRLALGASQAGLRRQFLREGLLLSCTGGVLGLFLTPLLFRLLRQMLPQRSILYENVGLNFIAVLSVALSVLACGLIFSSVPAWLQTRRENLAGILGGEALQPAVHKSGFMWDVLVISEIAFTMALCIGAALLSKSLWRLTHVDLGFDPTNVLVVRISVPVTPQARTSVSTTVADELLRSLAGLPGVEFGGITTFVPLSGRAALYDVFLPPAASSSELRLHNVSVEAVSGDYFRVLRIPTQKGRLLLSNDVVDAPKVCLINQAFVDKYFSTINPVGQTIAIAKAAEKYRIVGVVGNIRNRAIAQPPAGAIFVAYSQAPWSQFDIVLRTMSDPHGLVSSVLKKTHSIDPDLVLIQATTFEDILKSSLTDSRLRTIFLSVYAVLCLCLAGTGLYAVVAHAAQQRRREIALRMALGAARSDVFRLILRKGLVPIVTGLLVGGFVSIGVSRTVAKSLYGVSPSDHAIFLCVAALIFLLCISVTSIPAVRASNLNPIHWLRHN